MQAETEVNALFLRTDGECGSMWMPTADNVPRYEQESEQESLVDSEGQQGGLEWASRWGGAAEGQKMSLNLGQQ